MLPTAPQKDALQKTSLSRKMQRSPNGPFIRKKEQGVSIKVFPRPRPRPRRLGGAQELVTEEEEDVNEA